MSKSFTRSLIVSQNGNPINDSNPLPVDLGTTSISVAIASLSLSLETVKVGSTNGTTSGATMLAVNANRETIVYNTASVDSDAKLGTIDTKISSIKTSSTAMAGTVLGIYQRVQNLTPSNFKVEAELSVPDTVTVQCLTSSNLQTTEVNSAVINTKLAAVKTASQTLATAHNATGVRVKQETASNLKVQEASAATIATRVLSIESSSTTIASKTTDINTKLASLKTSSTVLAGAVDNACMKVKYNQGGLPVTDSVAVSTVSTILLATNSNRTNAIITNISTGSIMYLSIGKNAKARQGIPLYPKGSYEVNALNLTTRVIKGINASASTKLVSLIEY